MKAYQLLETAPNQIGTLGKFELSKEMVHTFDFPIHSKEEQTFLSLFSHHRDSITVLSYKNDVKTFSLSIVKHDKKHFEFIVTEKELETHKSLLIRKYNVVNEMVISVSSLEEAVRAFLSLLSNQRDA